MSALPRRRYGIVAWAAGALVLVALAVTLTLGGRSVGYAPQPRASRPAATPLAPMPELMQAPAQPSAQEMIRGVVRLPSGDAAPGATVTLHRLLTGWPEWRKTRVDTAITDEQGRFQFGVSRRYGHLVEFASARFAGGLRQVAAFEQLLELQLRPGYSIVGNVLNDVGAPVPNARVSIEPAVRDNRRPRSVYTAADGSYRFDGVAAGPARMVARHESWQPVTAPAILIGDRRDAEFRFERPTMAPLRGVVVSAGTGEPVEGATIELVPIDQSLGLVDAAATSSASDGSFVIEGLPRGSMQLWVRHPSFGAVSRTQAIGAAAAEISVELPNRTEVRGVVRVRTERAFRGGEVLQLRDSAGELLYATVSGGGAFAFAGAASPGVAEITCVVGGLSFRTMNGASVSVRLGEVDVNSLTVDVQAAPIIRGRFLDEAGSPVAGVALVSTQQLDENVQLLGDAAKSFDLLRAGNRLVHMTDRDRLSAVSGDGGVFTFFGAKPGRQLLRLRAGDVGAQVYRIQMPGFGATRDLGDVVLRPACGLAGRVSRGGLPFVGASVTATPVESAWTPLDRQGEASSGTRADAARSAGAQTVSGERGEFSFSGLEPGDYEVRARIPGRVARSGARVVTVVAGEPAGDIDIDLRAGRVLRGVVRNDAGQPLADALVSVRGRPGEVSRSRIDGSFAVELPRRRAELIVSLGDRSLERVVRVSRSQETLEVRLDAPPTCTIQGVVLGVPGGRRLQGVLMRATAIAAGEEDRSSVSRWVPTPDGELLRKRVASGRVRLEFWRDGYAPVVVERDLVANEVNQLGELTLERGARLRGVVVDEGGEPVSGAAVILGQESDLDLYEATARTGADGSFVLDGVTSRSSQLVVRHPAFAARMTELQLPKDVLASEPLRVSLARGGTIEVVVPVPEIPDNGLVFLRRDGRIVTSTVLDERGYAYFPNRSAGLYSVKLASGAVEERAVVVKPGVQVTRLLF
ncbi:MAG: carboxypeptidase-like regulatory domain-containing protein [Planctomycetota bacterium]|nr:carboxypeptidase-like regulatory domain-containing protein [Planctomycetota bacterium]